VKNNGEKIVKKTLKLNGLIAEQIELIEDHVKGMSKE